jgi:hypothetical protein
MKEKAFSIGWISQPGLNMPALVQCLGAHLVPVGSSNRDYSGGFQSWFRHRD